MNYNFSSFESSITFCKLTTTSLPAVTLHSIICSSFRNIRPLFTETKTTISVCFLVIKNHHFRLIHFDYLIHVFCSITYITITSNKSKSSDNQITSSAYNTTLIFNFPICPPLMYRRTSLINLSKNKLNNHENIR